MRIPGTTAFVALAASALLPRSAPADVLHLRDGGALRGRISHQSDTVTIETGNWKAVIPRDRVLRIEAEPEPIEQYARRRAALVNPSARDWADLGTWCAANGLDAQAREAWSEALRTEPDHDGARRALGFVRWKGQWVTEDEFHAAQCDVKFRGRWMPREEMAAILDSEKAARDARALAAQTERGKRAAADDERRLREDAADGEASARRAEAEARLRELEILRLEEEAAQRVSWSDPWTSGSILLTGTWAYPPPYYRPWRPSCVYPTPYAPYGGSWLSYGYTGRENGFLFNRGLATGSRITIRR
jgi:hypothetical protein